MSSPLFGKIKGVLVRRAMADAPIELLVFDAAGRQRLTTLDNEQAIALIEGLAHALAMGDG